MDQHDVEFQRFLMKLEFSDAVWKQLVAQKMQDNQDQYRHDQIQPSCDYWRQQYNTGLYKN